MASRLDVHIAWRAGSPTDLALRRRVAEEVREVSWTLSELQALAFEASQATGASHAYLLPKLELRLPLYDDGLRYRLVVQHVDRPAVTLVDEAGKKIADVTLL